MGKKTGKKYRPEKVMKILREYEASLVNGESILYDEFTLYDEYGRNNLFAFDEFEGEITYAGETVKLSTIVGCAQCNKKDSRQIAAMTACIGNDVPVSIIERCAYDYSPRIRKAAMMACRGRKDCIYILKKGIKDGYNIVRDMANIEYLNLKKKNTNPQEPPTTKMET